MCNLNFFFYIKYMKYKYICIFSFYALLGLRIANASESTSLYIVINNGMFRTIPMCEKVCALVYIRADRASDRIARASHTYDARIRTHIHTSARYVCPSLSDDPLLRAFVLYRYYSWCVLTLDPSLLISSVVNKTKKL